jgi:hypothetical protein
MTDIPPFSLGGETDPNAWQFSRLGDDGPLPNPSGHTFPMLTHDDAGRWRVIGTGFYINDGGFFATARHVIEDVFRNGEQISPLVILHLASETGLFGPSEFQLRPIRQCWLGDPADVALGVTAPARHKDTGKELKNWTWTLSSIPPPINAPVSTYAFPNHVVIEDGHRIKFAPHAYSGHVQAVGELRDTVRMPFPYLQVDLRIHGAASGGPILWGGHVVGINCSEYNNIDHPPGPAFGTQSCCLADAFLDDIVLPTESSPRRVTFDELVRAGCINVVGHATNGNRRPAKGTLISLANMLPTAAAPAIEIAIYA